MKEMLIKNFRKLLNLTRTDEIQFNILELDIEEPIKETGNNTYILKMRFFKEYPQKELHDMMTALGIKNYTIDKMLEAIVYFKAEY